MSQQRILTLVNSECNAGHSYNFNINNRTQIGFIEKMTFTGSGKALEADTPISDPENPDTKINVVAVLDYVKWVGGPTDPIEIRGRVSPKNRGILLECLSSLTGGSDVEASWTVKTYDYGQKKYYKSFHTDAKDIKLMLSEGVEVSVSETPDRFITQPVNFAFALSLTPKSEGADQSLCCATGAESKFARELGVNSKG